MTQIDIEYGHDHRSDEAWRRLTAAFRSGLEVVGLKEFSYRADERPQTVSDAMAERDRKRPAMRWLIEILLIAPEYHRMAIVGELAALIGCDLVRKRSLTPEERARALEQKLLEFGPAGERALAEVPR